MLEFAKTVSSEAAKAAVEAVKGDTSAARPRVGVPEVFEEQGISADEYERLNTYMRAVEMTPPEKWVDEGDRDVGFFLSELESFFAITGLPKAFWGLLARMHLSVKVRECCGISSIQLRMTGM